MIKKTLAGVCIAALAVTAFAACGDDDDDDSPTDTVVGGDLTVPGDVTIPDVSLPMTTTS
ncbi:MAG: hypothetical protein ABW328_08850 [Ilumatobacteraceae bacterium]